MPTRRHVLTGIGSLTAIAGCLSPTQESGGPSAVCGAGIGQNPGDVFSLTPQVQTFGSNDQPLVELVFPIRQATIESQNVNRLVVYSGDDILYRIPTTSDDDPVGPTSRYEFDDVIEYGQSIGHVPQNGIYHAVAVNRADEQIDEIRIEFRCYRPGKQEDS